MPLKDLPLPSDSGRQHSEKMRAYLQRKIKEKNGISFYEFMKDVLYAPGLGYYSAGAHKIGAAGDFVTAPEISPLFAECIVKQFQQIQSVIPEADLLELGAGTGRFCATFLSACEQAGCLPGHYYILEVSADFRERQQQWIEAQVPHLLSRVQWLDQLPTKPIKGMIFANEVMDAMPVHRFRVDDEIQELWVTYDNDQFSWGLNETSASALKVYVESLGIDFSSGYISEANTALPAWIASLEHCLCHGVILLIDYGFPRSEYYHPQRYEGTLMCHYRHRAHDDPFFFPGLQDITAHVDFTAVAEAASMVSLTVSGYTHQAAFLAGCGIMSLLKTTDALSQYNTSQQIQQLMHPSEMGELFKVMALTKKMDEPLVGFSQLNQCYRL